MSDKKVSNKKRQFSERLELFKEFKGLDSLKINDFSDIKKPKIDIIKKNECINIDLTVDLKSPKSKNVKENKKNDIDQEKSQNNEKINENIDECRLKKDKKNKNKKNNDKSNEDINIAESDLNINEDIGEIKSQKPFKKEKKNRKSDISPEKSLNCLQNIEKNKEMNESLFELSTNISKKDERKKGIDIGGSNMNINEDSVEVKSPKLSKKEKKNKKNDIFDKKTQNILQINDADNEKIRKINESIIEMSTGISKKDKRKEVTDKLTSDVDMDENNEITQNINNGEIINKKSCKMNKKIIDSVDISKEIININDKKMKEVTNDERSKINLIKKKSFILLENIDASVTKDDLDNYLKSNGLIVDKLSIVSGPLAVSFFNREKDLDRVFNICQGIYFKSNELLIAKSSLKAPVNESNVSNMSDLSIHIKNLEVSTTEEDISTLIGDMSKVRTITINNDKRTAIIDFTETQYAHECITKLDNFTLGENKLQASFLVKTQRPDQFVLKISNLPYGFNKVNVQESFPSAWKIKIIKGQNRYCHLHFKTIEDFEAVLHCEERVLVKGAPVTVEEITKSAKKVEKKDNFVLNVFNMPFDMTLNEIKEQYPCVRYIEMLKNADGLFMGSAKLNFDEKEDCEEALKNTKGLTLKHRRIRAEMKVEHSGTKDDEQVPEEDE